MADTKSTFLLDQSRRINSNNPDLKDWLRYGEIDEQCLKGIGFTYKENFEEAHEKLQASLNKALQPLVTILNNLIKASPFGSGTSINGLDDVRSKALEALTLFRAMNSEGKSDEQPDANLNNELIDMLKKFDYIYAKHIPLRKSSPGVDIKMGQNLKINFAYGKANLFNAKEEVWEPLMAIKRILFPTVTYSTSELGLVKFDHMARVPYTTMTLPAVIKQISKNWKNFGNNASKLNVSAKKLGLGSGGVDEKLKTIGDILGYIRNPAEEGSEEFKKIKTKLETILPGDAGLINKINNSGNRFPEAHTITEPTKKDAINRTKTLEQAYGDYRKHIPKGSFDNKKAQAAYIEAYEDELKSDRVNLLGDKGDDVYDGKSYLDSTAFELDGSGRLILKGVGSPEDKKEKESLERILGNLATVEQRIIGPILNEWASTVEQNTIDFMFGYPQRFCSNVDDFFQSDLPMITLQNVIPTKVSISFDFSNLDEFGYPMQGTLEISEVWSVEVAGGSLHLGTDTVVTRTPNGKKIGEAEDIDLTKSYPWPSDSSS